MNNEFAEGMVDFKLFSHLLFMAKIFIRQEGWKLLNLPPEQKS